VTGRCHHWPGHRLSAGRAARNVSDNILFGSIACPIVVFVVNYSRLPDLCQHVASPRRPGHCRRHASQPGHSPSWRSRLATRADVKVSLSSRLNGTWKFSGTARPISPRNTLMNSVVVPSFSFPLAEQFGNRLGNVDLGDGGGPAPRPCSRGVCGAVKRPGDGTEFLLERCRPRSPDNKNSDLYQVRHHSRHGRGRGPSQARAARLDPASVAQAPLLVGAAVARPEVDFCTVGGPVAAGVQT
jgi:hypothetical protein